MKNYHRWMIQLATLGPIGALPGRGTIASLATLPVAYVLNVLVSSYVTRMTIIGVLVILALMIINYVLKLWGRSDDVPEIVLDEFVGCLIACAAVNAHRAPLIGCFILFRFFDINKPLGIARIERLPGAWGIVGDDVVAAGVAQLVSVVAMYVFGC